MTIEIASQSTNDNDNDGCDDNDSNYGNDDNDESLQATGTPVWKQATPVVPKFLQNLPSPTYVNRAALQCSYLICHSSFLKTMITIEYGDILQFKRPVHLELFCKYSKKQQQIFLDAEHQCAQNAELKVLRKQANMILIHMSMERTSGASELPRVSEFGLILRCYLLIHARQAVKLILDCFDRFPLPKFRDQLRSTIMNYIDTLFNNNELFRGGAKQAKVERPKYARDCVLGRLQQLKYEAVQMVVARLSSSLQKIKERIRENAGEDLVSAAAQRRVLLPYATHAAVDCLVQWLYHGSLASTDTDCLLQTSVLATKLDMTSLAKNCMMTLKKQVLNELQLAETMGTTLHDLITQFAKPNSNEMKRKRSDDAFSTSTALGIVFQYVLMDKDPLAELKNLVVDTIAGSQDENVVALLQRYMNRDLYWHVTMLVMRRLKDQSVAMAMTKAEMDQSRFESEASCDEAITMKTEKDDQPMTEPGSLTTKEEIVDGVLCSSVLEQ